MPTSITSSGITFDDATTLTTGVLPTANIANAAVTPAKLSQPYTLATSVASTSGTAIDFTGIPSWAKRITVMLNGVSTNGSSHIEIRLGTSSGIITSRYVGGVGAVVGGGFSNTDTSTSGMRIGGGTASDTRSGLVTIALLGNNVWAANGVTTNINATNQIYPLAYAINAGDPLDRLRITTVNGTDTFDAGTINISYEG